jgi:hypothetical protein
VVGWSIGQVDLAHCLGVQYFRFAVLNALERNICGFGI